MYLICIEFNRKWHLYIRYLQLNERKKLYFRHSRQIFILLILLLVRFEIVKRNFLISFSSFVRFLSYTISLFYFCVYLLWTKLIQSKVKLIVGKNKIQFNNVLSYAIGFYFFFFFTRKEKKNHKHTKVIRWSTFDWPLNDFCQFNYTFIQCGRWMLHTARHELHEMPTIDNENTATVAFSCPGYWDLFFFGCLLLEERKSERKVVHESKWIQIIQFIVFFFWFCVFKTLIYLSFLKLLFWFIIHFQSICSSLAFHRE